MGAITNKTGFRVNRESALGVPTTTDWKVIQPNNVPTFGATITTIRRRFISTNRQGAKGTITDVESSPEFELDLIADHLIEFGEGFVHALFQGAEVVTVPTSVDADSYTVPAMTTTLVLGDLVAAKGFAGATNNGLKEVNTGATSTDILIVGAGLTVEATPPTDAVIEVAGFRGATGDLQIDANEDLISTVKDLTEFQIVVGQYIHIGGQAAANRFADAADFGAARVVSIATNLIVLEKRTGTFVADTGTGKRVDILFGRFLRNVAIDDGNYVERSYHIEEALTDIPAASYIYAKGNRPNTMAINVAAQEKALMVIGFLGTDTDPPTTSRLTGPSTARAVNQAVAFNTSLDVARLRIQEVDETGITTAFTNFSLALNNNLGRELAVGTLGAHTLALGDFDVSLEGEVHFDDVDTLDAIRNNTTVGLDFVLRNDDGGIIFDYPSFTLGGGGQTLNRNETIKLALTGEAFEHDTLGFSIGISLLPFMPTPTAT